MQKFGLLALFICCATFAESEKPVYKISCDEVEFIVKNINDNLPDDIQLDVECEETYDTMLWGAVKKNFKSEVHLSATVPLCSDAEYVYSQVFKLGYGAHIGVSTKTADEMGQILYDHGISYRFGASGSTVGTMYHFKSIQFPKCD